MATYSKQLLSGSTNGKAIKVAATASSGDLIHTAVSGTTAFDEIWIYAYNSSASAVILTIQYGGTTSPDNDIKISIPSQSGLVTVVPGLLLNNAQVVRAFAGTTNVITISGYVNRVA